MSICVRRHSYDGPPIDLTDRVTSVDIALSTREPWTSISVAMRLPWAERRLAPDPGDWLTVQREDNGRTIAWGNVDVAPSPGLIREGTKLHGGTTRTQASSWLSVLGGSQIYAQASAARQQTVGTMYSLDDWSRRFTEILGVINGDHGERLTRLLRLLGNLQLPQSLGGGLLGDSIAVAHDQRTAERLGLHSKIDPVVGPRSPRGIQAWPNSQSALAMLVSLFQPNRDMIELFEVMCPLDRGPGGNLSQIISETRELEASRLETQSQAQYPESSAQNEAAMRARGQATVTDAGLVGQLRAVPALVYRIYPGRTESFSSYAKALPFVGQAVGGGFWGQVSAGAARTRVLQLADGLFPGHTWPGPEIVFETDECPYFSEPTRSNAARINAVTVSPDVIGDAIKFWEEAGLPILDERDIARLGLRLMDVRWPYIAPDDADMVAWSWLIAGLGAQLFLHRERFYSGTMRVRLRLDMQPGRVFRLKLPGGRSFDGYADSVRHSIAREGTKLVGWTTISYSRGSYDNERPPAARPVSASRSGSWGASTSSSRSGSWGTPTKPQTNKNRRTADPMTTEQRFDAALRIYAYFARNGLTPAWALACVHQCGFESAWNTTAVNWGSDEIADGIGLFQITVVKGLGSPKPDVFGGRTAGTREQAQADPSRYWDAQDPSPNCERVLLATRKYLASKLKIAADPTATVYDSYFTLLNSAVGGGYKAVQPPSRLSRYAEGQRLFGSAWTDPWFSRRQAPVSAVVTNTFTAPIGSLGIPDEVRRLIATRVGATP